jgi:invasion protein IalB
MVNLHRIFAIGIVGLVVGLALTAVQAPAPAEAAEFGAQTSGTGQRFGAWVLACPPPDQSKAGCLLAQEISEHVSNKVVFVWLIQYDDKGQLLGAFRLPIGVFVNRGLIMKADPKTDGLRVEYTRCDPGECQAVFSITDDLAKQLTSAKVVTVTIALTSGKTTDIELSMAGFADALNALIAKSPAAAKVAQNKVEGKATQPAIPPLQQSGELPLSRFGRREALVIGIGAYEAVPELPNPRHDAADVAAELSDIGFDVTLLDDLDASSMRRALQDFERKADGASIALIFYAGHGLELNGMNYLIPIDAKLNRDTDIDDEAVSLTRVLNAIVGARDFRLVILDACRNNPFVTKMGRADGSRAVNRGLARIEPGSSTLVAFSAKDGTTAADGGGRNSPFVRALLANLKTRGLEINLLFRRVRDQVMSDTGNQQEPFVYGSLSSVPIYLAGQ